MELLHRHSFHYHFRTRLLVERHTDTSRSSTTLLENLTSKSSVIVNSSSLPRSVSVRSSAWREVKKHQSKADVVLDPDLLPPGEMAVFADDSIAEHLDARLIASPHRVRRVTEDRLDPPAPRTVPIVHRSMMQET